MRRAALLGLLLLLIPTDGGFSYTRPRFIVDSIVQQSRWPTPTPIPVSVNIDPPNMIVAGSQPFEAVRNTFEIRSAYSSIRFAPVLASSPTDLGNDGTNLVTFVDTAANRSVTAGFGAVTFFWFDVIGGEPVVTESDVAFNPTSSHSTTGSGGFDIENLGGHEITHFLSLEHSAVLASTGYPNFVSLDTTKRSLALDDVAGTEFLYPLGDTAARTGALSGTVLKGGTTPVFGAHVVAVRQGDGVVVSELSVFDGEWRIDALPPGDYTVYAEPFDGPYQETLIDDGIYSNPFDTAVRTTFAGGNPTPTVHTVTAGGEVSGIAVSPSSSAPALNSRWLGLGPSATTPILDTLGVAATQGNSAFLTVAGPGIDQVPDDGVSITGSGVNVSSQDVVRGTLFDPYMIVEVSVDLDAPPGARSILVDDGSEIAALTGGFEVLRLDALPGLMRSDEVTGLAPVTPALASIFPLDATGPDAFPGIGEGTLREAPGSDDDDDLYVPEVPSGYLDADPDVATDLSRPLVFYRLTDPTAVLHVNLTAAGRIEIVY